MRSDEWVAGVDFYSSGSLYRKALQGRGYKVVHVQSSADIPKDLAGSFEPSCFEELLVFDASNPEQVVGRLRELGVQAVFIGTESGVAVGDFLASRLDLPGNDAQSSHLRLDKFSMHEALAESGVASYRRHLIRNAGEALRWMEQEGIQFPVMTKPRSGAATQFVRRALDRIELVRNIDEALGKVDLFGKLVDELIVEEYLSGPEFAINGVVVGGSAYVSDVWEYHKRITSQGSIIYDRDIIISCLDPNYPVLTEYVFNALKALHFQNGTFHAEVKLEQCGPVLLEVAARPMGSNQPSIVERCTGTSQIDLMIDAYLDPQVFARKTATPYRLLRKSQVIELASHSEGVVREIPLEALLHPSHIPSYSHHKMNIKVGSRVRMTENLLDSHLGTVFLLHEDGEQIDSDYRRIREMEESGGILLE
jgi:biotin carboxylase